MGAEGLIHKLATLGVELAADGDRLRFRPVDRVTPDLLAELRAHKADLLAALGAGVADADPCQPVPTDPAAGTGGTLAAIRAAGRRKLAELGWIVGDRLAGLPEELQGLVMPREGWTPASWAEHMRYLAGRCAELHPDRADLYRRASGMLVTEARRIERGGPA
ncbi:MAG: hypothetical protein L6Q93_09685 [Phycisphaerae bacterium]|nr:hypothetical protein [Phycisphaerae bacterium]NUQ07966.1 hypothetical protein [Phycisphaerae bacterium]